MTSRVLLWVLVLVIALTGFAYVVHAPVATATAAPSNPDLLQAQSSPPPSLSTSDLGWTSPTILNPAIPTNNNLGGIALSGDHSGVIVYEKDGPRATILATRFVPGGGYGGTDWVTPAALSRGGCSAWSPSVAMDATGDAIAVWYDSCNYAIHAARFTPSTGWSADVGIDQPYWLSVSPQIAMNANGFAFATWEAWDGARYHVFANRYVPGTGWGTATAMDPNNNNWTSGANVAVDGSGNAFVVWNRLDGSTYHIKAKRYDATLGWVANYTLEPLADWAIDPTVSMDSAGNAIVAFIQWDGAYSVYANRWDAAGAAWSGEVALESQSTWADFRGPSVSANNGSAVVAWGMAGPGTDPESVWANRYTAGSGWGTESDVDGFSGTGWSATAPAVRLDRFGNASIIYQLSYVASTPVYTYIEGVRYSALTGAASSYQTLDFGRVGNGAPIMAMDASGNALAAWNYNDNSVASPRNGILSNRYTFGVGWRSYGPQAASWDQYLTPGWLQLETNTAGDSIFSWTQNDGPVYDGYASLYTPANGWGPATRIEDLNLSSVTEEWSAIDPNGNAIVLFRIYDGVKYGVDAVYYSTATGWSRPVRISDDANNPGDLYDNYWLRIAMDANGDGLAVWIGWNGTAENVYGSWFSGTSHTWSAPFRVPAPGSVNSAVVGLDAKGDAVVAWQAWDGAQYSVYASEYTSATGWSTGALVEHTNLYAGSPYGLAMNANGDAALSWGFWSGSYWRAAVNTYTPSGGWGTETILSNGPGDGDPAIPSVDGYGNTMLAYQLWDGSQWDVYTATKPVGGSWTTPEKLNAGTGDATGISTALDYFGNGFAAWSQFNGIGYDILSRRYIAGQGWLPTNVINTPAPAVPETDSGSAIVTVDGHGDAMLGWNQWHLGALVPYAAEYIVGSGQPDLNLTSPAADLLTRNSTVTVAGATDPGASVTIDGAAVSVAGDGSFSKTVVLPDGAHTFVVVATNAAGLSTKESRTVTVDTTPPALSILTPSMGTITNQSVVHVTGSTEADATVVVNGVTAAVSSTGVFALDLAIQEGANTIAATATDPAGNVRTASVQVTLDTHAPSLTLTSPRAGVTNNPSVTVTGTTDPGATVTVDGSTVSVSGTGAFTTTASLAQGVHTFVVVATDAAGNHATAMVTVTVDTTPPSVAITGPANGDTVTSPTVLVTGTAEPGSTVVVNGYNAAVSSTGAFSVQVALAPGANNITATATDAAGNINSASISVTFNDPLPGTQQKLADTSSALNTYTILLAVLVVVSLALGVFQMMQIRKLRSGSKGAPETKPEGPSPPPP